MYVVVGRGTSVRGNDPMALIRNVLYLPFVLYCFVLIDACLLAHPSEWSDGQKTRNKS